MCFSFLGLLIPSTTNDVVSNSKSSFSHSLKARRLRVRYGLGGSLLGSQGGSFPPLPDPMGSQQSLSSPWHVDLSLHPFSYVSLLLTRTYSDCIKGPPIPE